jgi:tRNA dimethylallyltransferase
MVYEKVKKCVIICGPTASGKTSLAVEISRRIGGEVINADSRQIYRFMDVGTGKPTQEERKEVPHHLIDLINPDERFDAGRFIEVADRAYDEIVKRGKFPIMVGGTGLYIRAFEKGLIPSPPIPQEIREEILRKKEEKGVKYLYYELKKIDPETANRISPADFPRIERALSYYLSTGQKISEARKRHGFKEKRYETLKIYIEPPREVLYEAIKKRIYDMIKRGWIEETERLLKMGYDENSPGFTSVGYREIASFIRGKVSMESAIASIYKKTKDYARRQIFWFRKENPFKIENLDVSMVLKAVEEFYEICS